MLAAVAVAAFAAIAPSDWVDAKRAMRGHLDSLEDAIGPAAKRTADWLGGGVGTVRDAFAQGTAGATVSGPARVVDGDTLEVRGTRVRLHGIDAPESKQRCRSAERTWPCGHEANRYADLLFEVVTRRYLTSPVLITTNKPFSQWAEVFSSDACVVTLVDRLIHRSEIVQLDGESYRLREAKEQAAKRSKARSRRGAKSRASRGPRS